MSPLNRIAVAAASLFLVAALSFGTAGVAQATTSLPSTSADTTGMVDYPGNTKNNTNAVRTITQAGSDLWLGGVFDQVDDANGTKVADASGLVPFHAPGTVGAGTLDMTPSIPTFTASSGLPEVYSSSLGPNGNLYIAGNFNSVDGQTRHNVAEIDPMTGSVLAFNPSVSGIAFSVLATQDAVYVGTAKLLSFQLNGSPTVGYKPPSVATVSTLRGHKTSPNFRSIVKLGNTLVAACQCDSLTDSNGPRYVKAIVEINATTGNWVDWEPSDIISDPTKLSSNAAFGIQAIIHDDASGDPVIYLAAGGNDWTAAYPFMPDSNGNAAPLWHTDTSGSSQAITWYQGSLIVGGHFDYTANLDASPPVTQCGSNSSPTPGCYFSPKLVAMSATNGHVLLNGTSPWNPGICCRYNGVWDVTTGNDGSTLSVGGEFDKAGGSWTCNTFKSSCLSGARNQHDFASFSGPAAANETLSVATAGSGSGTVSSIPAGISCGLSCTADFPTGNTVMLMATPDGSSTFGGWASGDTDVSLCSSTTCNVTMSQLRSVTATFTATSPSTVTIDDTDSPVMYNGWQSVLDSSASGGSYRTSSVIGDRVTWKTPSTDSFTWFAHTGSDQGIASVKIDGSNPPNGQPASVDLSLSQNSSVTYSGLASQVHTVVIKVTGNPGLNSTGPTYGVSVDAFQVGSTTPTQESDPKVQYNDWTGAVQSKAYGGSYRISSTGVSTATVTFTGTAIDWITAMGTSYGEASITIDGLAPPTGPSTVDLYNSSQVWQTVIPFGGLSSGQHTMVIHVLGMKNSSSTGYKVVVDGFTIHS